MHVCIQSMCHSFLNTEPRALIVCVIYLCACLLSLCTCVSRPLPGAATIGLEQAAATARADVEPRQNGGDVRTLRGESRSPRCRMGRPRSALLCALVFGMYGTAAPLSSLCDAIIVFALVICDSFPTNYCPCISLALSSRRSRLRTTHWIPPNAVHVASSVAPARLTLQSHMPSILCDPLMHTCRKSGD